MDEPGRGILNRNGSSNMFVMPPPQQQQQHQRQNQSAAAAAGPSSEPGSANGAKASNGIIQTDGKGNSSSMTSPMGVTIKIEEPPEQRGRSRNKQSDATSSFSTSRSRTKLRSLSRVSIAEHELLRWTILRHDPSERLHRDSHAGTAARFGDISPQTTTVVPAGAAAGIAEDIEDVLSDEEQISDVENDYEVDAALDYDLGARVLPNFATSIQQTLDSQATWLAAYRRDIDPQQEKKKVQVDVLENCKRAIQHIAKRALSPAPAGAAGQAGHAPLAGSAAAHECPQKKAFLLYLEDLNTSHSEKLYALTYTFGAVLANRDTLYIVVQCDAADVEAHLVKVREQVAFLLDATSAALDHLDIIILTLHHPYPRHLLTEISEAFQPSALIIPLQIATGSLAGYVSFVPTLVVRKKLKRSRRKGIYD
ncbi:Imp21p Ecym_4011 [Eremothecium cymbalariae DBVPG|uniref:UspA domain-containing protein n=1 Tax=Eremothecium cymbalariae (strain CBS 270.75 / DBVPG 7215 / KCTC 17166 / NRRL Y-17582) TaxID=931890 RepID=G8JSU2_ERECY|nr:hypothetical protein Ecym_4011 [Eremothecium cymbalariae DBVPG\